MAIRTVGNDGSMRSIMQDERPLVPRTGKQCDLRASRAGCVISPPVGVREPPAYFRRGHDSVELLSGLLIGPLWMRLWQ
jgi:hypothetical protein